jgi:hypothetical protein
VPGSRAATQRHGPPISGPPGPGRCGDPGSRRRRKSTVMSPLPTAHSTMTRDSRNGRQRNAWIRTSPKPATGRCGCGSSSSPPCPKLASAAPPRRWYTCCSGAYGASEGGVVHTQAGEGRPSRGSSADVQGLHYVHELPRCPANVVRGTWAARYVDSAVSRLADSGRPQSLGPPGSRRYRTRE